jgi:hypothetical protein
LRCSTCASFAASSSTLITPRRIMLFASAWMRRSA